MFFSLTPLSADPRQECATRRNIVRGLQLPARSTHLNQMELPVMMVFTATALTPVPPAPVCTLVTPVSGPSVIPVRKHLATVWILRVPPVEILPTQTVLIQTPVMEQDHACPTMLLQEVPVRTMETNVQMIYVMVPEFVHIHSFQQVLPAVINLTLTVLLRTPVMVRVVAFQIMPL